MSLGMLLAAALVFIAVMAGAAAFRPQPAAGKAIKRVTEAPKRTARKPDATEAANQRRKQTTQEALKGLSQAQRQSRARQLSVKGRLAQAGLENISVSLYWMVSLTVGAVLGLVGFLIQGSILGAAGGALVGALGLPRWLLGMLVSNRQKKFTNQLADGIDMIVRGVKSGLPLNQCLQMIASESPDPLRSEFRSLVDGQAMGVPLDQNLGRMYERMPLAEVNFFNIVLIIQQKTGGNLSESLGNLSSVLRARKLMREKVKAMSSEAKASAMIIGSLPFIVMGLVYMVRPDYMAILFTHPTGHMILGVSACMYGTGIFVMRKMINFPI